MASTPVSSISNFQNSHYLHRVMAARLEVARQILDVEEMSANERSGQREYRCLNQRYLHLDNRVEVLVNDFVNLRWDEFIRDKVIADVRMIQENCKKLGMRITDLGQEIDLRNRMQRLVDEAIANTKASKPKTAKEIEAEITVLARDHPAYMGASLIGYTSKARSTCLELSRSSAIASPSMGSERAFTKLAQPLCKQIKWAEAAIASLNEKDTRKFDELTSEEDRLQEFVERLPKSYNIQIELLTRVQEECEVEIVKAQKKCKDDLRPLEVSRRAAGKGLIALEKEFPRLSQSVELSKSYAERERIFLQQEEDAYQSMELIEREHAEYMNVQERRWHDANRGVMTLQKQRDGEILEIRQDLRALSLKFRELKQQHVEQLAILEDQRQRALEELAKLEHEHAAVIDKFKMPKGAQIPPSSSAKMGHDSRILPVTPQVRVSYRVQIK